MLASSTTAFRAAVQRLLAARSRARSRRALSGLNEHLLLDVGLERADIEGVVRGRVATSFARGRRRAAFGSPALNAVPGTVATVRADSPASKAA